VTPGFTIGAGQVWLANVQCDGNETRLTECTIPAFGTTNCSHAEDAGVSCPTCTQGATRLRGGTATSGRLEICNNNIWGTVCDNSWNEVDAWLLVDSLGSQPLVPWQLLELLFQMVWAKSGWIMSCVLELTDCATGSLGPNACGHEEDVGVNCANAPTAGKHLLLSLYRNARTA
jgi:deleted-in-malignant-brain-tumors protein 1